MLLWRLSWGDGGTNHSQIHPQKTNMSPIKGAISKVFQTLSCSEHVSFRGSTSPTTWQVSKILGSTTPLRPTEAHRHPPGWRRECPKMAPKNWIKRSLKTNRDLVSYLKQKTFMLWYSYEFSNLLRFSSVLLLSHRSWNCTEVLFHFMSWTFHDISIFNLPHHYSTHL